jgi:hypothetical protein
MSLFKKYTNTLKTLYSEPRQVIDSFLHGGYDSFLHPFKFVLIGVISIIVINTLALDYTVEPDLSDLPSESEVIRLMGEWTQIVSVRAATQFLPFSMFLLQIVALSVGAMLFLRGKTDGFFDHIVINSYSIGASMIALPLLLPVWGLSGQPLTDPFINSTIPAMVVAGVILWIYNLYFRLNGFMDWIRVLSAYVTGFVIFVVLSGIVSSAVAYTITIIQRISEISG